MKTVAIHQPQYIPWVPYFDKILRSDVFVFLDNVQFQNNGLQNRNMIKGPQGAQWLTLPVKHSFGQLISETKIDGDKARQKHLKTMEMNYKKAPYYEEIFDIISKALNNANDNLSDINCNLVEKILDYLDYRGETHRNSELGVEGKGSELILNICKKTGADIYLSGQGGKNYLDMGAFEKSGIKLEFQTYANREYGQCFPKAGFCPNLSIVDLLFNEGKNSLALITAGRDVNQVAG